MVRYLRVSGLMASDGTLRLRLGYLTKNARGAVSEENSPLQIEMRRDERILLRWGVTMLDGCHRRAARQPPVVVPVRAKVPFPADTTRIVYLLHGLEVASFVVGGERPALSDASVHQTKSGWRIEWTASHPAKAEMLHHVRVSGDGGARWRRLGSRLPRPALTVKEDLLFGPRCVVEVVTYDGVHTESLRVEVPGRPTPRLHVEILSPRRSLASSLVLRAFGAIPGRFARASDGIEYRWEIDGAPAGEGASHVASRLDPGTHRVVVEAIFQKQRAHAEAVVEVLAPVAGDAAARPRELADVPVVVRDEVRRHAEHVREWVDVRRAQLIAEHASRTRAR